MSRSIVAQVLLVWLGIVAGGLQLAASSRQFGDIGVTIQSMASGATFHGYLEQRFTIVNSNPGRDHVVTVELPSDTHIRNRESIGSLQRTIHVSAGATVNLPLYQPALPINGTSQARIRVDGRDEGVLPLPRGLNHAELHHGSNPPRPYLVSRSLDSSALDTALTRLAGGASAGVADFSPMRATGRPNVPHGRGGYQGQAWMPQRMGGRDWLELRYADALIPEKVRVFKTGREDNLTDLEFFDKTGRIIGTLKHVTSNTRHVSRFQPVELGTTSITQAVHRVRLQFDGSRGGYVGVDAVELIGKGRSVYASGATASSTYATVHRGGAGKAVDKATVLRSELEVVEWSDEWLAYTPFDAVVLSEADLRGMPGPVSQAFWRHVEAGGLAVVLGRAVFPKDVEARRRSAEPGVTRFEIGFGACLELEATDTRQLDAGQLNQVESFARQTGAAWSSFGDLSTANAQFPVIENLSIPVRGIAFIMLVFIVCVGPLNIFVLARINRRIWMLWTIPVISLLTCGVVFVYSLFSEGITPTVRTESVTLLDHSSRRATTLGRLAYYCPLTPSDGLAFDYETEVFPIVSRGWSGGTSKSIDLSDGQRLTRGWLQARMPAHFAVRRSETRRERLQIERDSVGNWRVMNGLGAPIKRLIFRSDASQETGRRARVWRTDAVAPGAAAVLQPVDVPTETEANGSVLRRLFMDGRWSSAEALKLLEPGALPAGCYVAEMDGAPFLVDGLAGKKHIKSASVVVGRLSVGEVAL